MDQSIILNIYNKYLTSHKVCTDTRHITSGSIFFALKGPNFNANAFAKEALKKGASYAVIDDAKYQIDDRYILVEDSLATLQMLAKYHRKQLNIPFIGITGSNGKTTTKELMYAVLSQKYKVLATKGNFNNHIGVPLTILSIDHTIEVAIIEMGANRLGDIAELCDIAEPTHGLITNIGKAHIGKFGSQENIIRGKSELYQFLIQHKGHVWINSNQDILMNMSKRFENPSLYPQPADDYSCEMISASPFINYKSMSGEQVSTQLIGTYNFDNITTALVVGNTFGVDEAATNQAIANYKPDNNRSQIIKKGTNTYILDAYNANPNSMEVAISSIAQMEAQQKVIILGDMYELGDESDKEHAKLGQLLSRNKFTQVYFCGKYIKEALTSYPKGHYFENRDDLAQSITKAQYSNTLFLLKASRGIGLEKIMEVI